MSIGYDAPWRQVHGLLLGAAKQTSGLRTDPAPYVLQRSLDDFYVQYELIAWVDNPVDRPMVASVLHACIQDAFNAAGVQIMSPHYVLQPRNPVLADASAAQEGAVERPGRTAPPALRHAAADPLEARLSAGRLRRRAAPRPARRAAPR